MSEYVYPGDELTLFAHAHNWKRYFAGRLRPLLRGDVLEVGAGLGETTAALLDNRPTAWLCLEPDAALADRLRARVAGLSNAARTEVATGALADLPPDRRFDCILYIDVLEHIADDRTELNGAAERLRPDGRLIVLAPAHNRLYTPFDRAIGHFRRYNRPMLRALAPSGLTLERLEYLDAVGLLCSVANRLVLGRERPSLANILFWDRVLVPLSRLVDPLTGYRVGRSLVGVWRRPLDDTPAPEEGRP